MLRRGFLVLVLTGLAAFVPAVAQAPPDAASLPHPYLFGDFPARDVSSLVFSPLDEVNSSQSIESLTTFGLMQNEYDFLFEPADLGALKGWKRDRTIGNKWDSSAQNEGAWFLITNLGNTALTSSYAADFNFDGTVDAAEAATSHSYQIGAWGKLGPGNLAVIAGFFADKTDASLSHGYSTSLAGLEGTRRALLAPPVEIDTSGDATVGKLEHKGLDLYVAYGFLLGDTSSLGFSLRHVNGKVIPSEVSLDEPNSKTLIAYTDPTDPNLPTSRRVLTSESVSNSRGAVDRTSDAFAAEYKLWAGSEWSFKVRASYAKMKADVDASALFGPQSATAEYDSTENYTNVDGVWQLDNRTTLSDVATAAQDLSWKGHEWSLAGRFNWYRDAGQGLQVDLGYTKGDFSLKNRTPWQLSATSLLEHSDNITEPPLGLTLTERTTDQVTTSEAVGSEDLSSDRWFAGVKYLWQWERADFLIGLRYRQDRAKTSFSGPLVFASSLVATGIDGFGPPPTYASTGEFTLETGTAAFTGEYKTKQLELPIAAEFHLTDQVALRFGAVHVFDTSEATGSDDWMTNFYTDWSTETSADGTVTEVNRFTDNVTTLHADQHQRDKTSTNYTLYRAGLAYTFNDHVVAELMVAEHSGDVPTRQEAVGLNTVVASATFRF